MAKEISPELMRCYNNTKALIESLANPDLQGLDEPQFPNNIDYFLWWLDGINGIVFDFDVYLETAKENLQREYVWNLKRQKSFIKRLFKRKAYIPNIVVNVLPPNKEGKRIFKVIDGKQRLTTIARFIQNEFDINGYYFSDLVAGFISHLSRLKFETYYDPLPDHVLVALFEEVNFFEEPQDYERFERIKNKVLLINP